MKKSALRFTWRHFDARRTKDARGDASILVQNPVSLSAPAGSTRWDHVYAIASSALRPFPVKSISERLKEHISIRGCVFYGHVGDQIQKIMMNYPTLRWWMEADGLVIAEPADEIGPLDPFDRFAGELVSAKWKQNKLLPDDFLGIARQLDGRGFVLKQNLQPAQWKPIAEHNMKFAQNAIRTFEAAARNAKFSRSIRRRLYVARDRYKNAQLPITPIEYEY
jgi:hypothetical protein